MRFFNIHVEEERPTPTINKQLYKELKIEIINELPKEKEYHIMKEYDRENRKIFRIGVQAENAARVEIKGAWGESVLLYQSIYMKDYWYDKSSIWIEDGFEEKNESIFGINSCGEWTVTTFGEQGEILETEKVKIIPKLLTIEQYNLMKLEVKKIFEELTYQPKEPDKRTIIKELNLSLYPIAQLDELLVEWKEWLSQVEENPAEILLKARVKKSRLFIRKWDSTNILESNLYPYREKLSEKLYEKSSDVIEHKMIKYMLERIKERVEQEKKTEASANENLLRTKLNLENLNLDIEKNNDEATEKIIKRKQQIENDIQLLEIRKLSWNTIFSTVRNYLDLPLFNVQEEEPEWTHLFVSHPVYRSIFEVYEQITSLSPFLTRQERDFEKAMVSSPHLYEVWILFQLIRQLQKIQFNSKDIVNSMMEHFKGAGTLSGWRKIFESPNGLAGIYYEKEFQLENGRNAKPDYTLLFKKNNSTLWDAHILDAKYKPYILMGETALRNDLEHSGRRYLTIADDSIKLKSAALVHIDKNIENWNVDINRRYSISHFSAQPEILENITTYMKRILHFFNKQLEICPSCGIASKPISQDFKETYICDSCNEVWVKNTCKRIFHPRPQALPELLKYPSGNYNMQVGTQWNVFCPVCSREANGNRIEQDIFGRRV